jgi:hypothetical protein
MEENENMGTIIENDDGSFELNMTDDEYAALVMTYVDNALQDVSKDQFYEVLDTTGDVKEALFAAIVNEVVNVALEKFIDEFESKEQE